VTKAEYLAWARQLGPGSPRRYVHFEDGTVVDRRTGECRTPVPRSVEACAVGAWDVLLWPRAALAADETAREEAPEPRLRRFLCKSWRCPRCRGWVGAQDYRRIVAGMGQRQGWIYAVLTFDQRALGGDRWRAYRLLQIAWTRLRSALQWRAGGRGLAYIWTLEQHRTGWPHINVLLHSDRIRREADAGGVRPRWAASRGGGGKGRMVDVLAWGDEVLMPMAVRAGYGRVGWIEDVKHVGAIARYQVKLAAELISVAKDQTPVAAPPGWRRYGASRGLLPPRQAGDGTWTGMIVPGGSPRATWGSVEAWLGLDSPRGLVARWRPEDWTAGYPDLEELENSMEGPCTFAQKPSHG
jgi:hypothetical protein